MSKRKASIKESFGERKPLSLDEEWVTQALEIEADFDREEAKEKKKYATRRRKLKFSFEDKDSSSESSPPRTPEKRATDGTFSFRSLSKQEKSNIEDAMLAYCRKQIIRTYTCRNFRRGYVRQALLALLFLNKRFGSMTRQIPIGLFRLVSEFLWPKNQPFIYHPTTIAGQTFVFVTAGWCSDNESVFYCHPPYIVDTDTDGGVDYRIPAEVFVLYDVVLGHSDILGGTSGEFTVYLPNQKCIVEMAHVTDGTAHADALSHQMANAVWKFGGIHPHGVFPAPLFLFSNDDLGSSIMKGDDP